MSPAPSPRRTRGSNGTQVLLPDHNELSATAVPPPAGRASGPNQSPVPPLPAVRNSIKSNPSAQSRTASTRIQAQPQARAPRHSPTSAGGTRKFERGKQPAAAVPPTLPRKRTRPVNPRGDHCEVQRRAEQVPPPVTIAHATPRRRLADAIHSSLGRAAVAAGRPPDRLRDHRRQGGIASGHFGVWRRAQAARASGLGAGLGHRFRPRAGREALRRTWRSTLSPILIPGFDLSFCHASADDVTNSVG